MSFKILEEIGLSKAEARIYLALLKVGQSTATAIVKEALVPSSKVYEFLDRMVKKGIVSYSIKSGKKYFNACRPELLSMLIEEKREEILRQEKELNALIPKLSAIKRKEKNENLTETFEGVKGAKLVYESILEELKAGETQFVIGAPKIGNELLENYLLGWHKKRIQKGIKCKYIYNSDAREYGEVREKMPLTKVRYLPENIIAPVWVEIFRDNVLIGHIKDFKPVLFLIKNKEIAKGYLNYFKIIWNASAKAD